MPEVPANSDTKIDIKIEAPDVCGRYTTRRIDNLNIHAPTPQWMKDRLERSGQRSISALVDISNYVMLETGIPTHFSDAQKIVGGAYTVRWGKPGEKIELLNGQTVDVDAELGVICDANGPKVLAGIMGGEDTTVTDEPPCLSIQSAFGLQKAIQGRCRRLNFSTDAAYRYERGVDFGQTEKVLNYITRLVTEICGTETTAIGPVIDAVTVLPERHEVKMRADRARKVIGMNIDTAKKADCFKRLGFEFTL